MKYLKNTLKSSLYSLYLWGRGLVVKAYLLYNPMVMGSNSVLSTLGKVSETHFLGSTHAM